VGFDHASLTYTQVPVPAQVTVKPSSIPGAGLGVFSTTAIKKGVRMGPYEGVMISKTDMGDLYNTAYAWEVGIRGTGRDRGSGGGGRGGSSPIVQQLGHLLNFLMKFSWQGQK